MHFFAQTQQIATFASEIGQEYIRHKLSKRQKMNRLQHIYEVIAKEGFANICLQEIDNYVNEIQNGTRLRTYG